MQDTLLDLLFIVNRYLHILCTTVLVGGTLFFEFVFPLATDELKREQQQHVFSRARWGFKAIVWSCAIILIVTGTVSSIRRWHDYRYGTLASVTAQATQPDQHEMSDVRRPVWWWGAHVATGLIALLVASLLMAARRPPENLLSWMRLILMILLIVIFFGTTSRHMRLSLYEQEHSRRTPE
jgi:quinol-cytochrome oxidoreductase complex cytochrome b subunit